MTRMTMDADQLHPPPGDSLVATADERRNVAGLDNVMNVFVAIVSLGEKASCPQK